MHNFKIWNQGNDGSTMGIRAANIDVVGQIAHDIARPSDDGTYSCLSDFLSALSTAETAPSPYRRTVDVLWRTAIGYGSHRYLPGRTLEVTYSGNVRATGGFAAQCYVIIDPQGYQHLGPLHLAPISVEVIPGQSRDLIEVTV